MKRIDHACYVHWPWCRVRCPYCAFNVHTDPEAPWTAYTDALLRQHDAFVGLFDRAPATLFHGGGTPSLVPTTELKRLIAAIAPTGEVAMEANPEDVTHARLEGWLQAGVTRVSLGIQTFDRKTAGLLRRRSVVDTHRDVATLVGRAGFDTWSLDLIFAVPGQSLENFARDIDIAVNVGAPHVSLYGLTAHPGTPYHRLVSGSEVAEIDDELWSDMLDLAEQRLQSAGLVRYEVSNFARHGHECAHNVLVWRGHPYLGLGAGAHGRLPDGRRMVGWKDPAKFMASPTRPEEVEEVTQIQAALDLLVGSSRHIGGVDHSALAAVGYALDDRVVAGLVREGVLAETARGVALDGRGWHLADAVLSRLAGALYRVGSS